MPVRLRVIRQNKRDERVKPAQGLHFYLASEDRMVPVMIEERRNKNDKWTPVEVVDSETQ